MKNLILLLLIISNSISGQNQSKEIPNSVQKFHEKKITPAFPIYNHKKGFYLDKEFHAMEGISTLNILSNNPPIVFLGSIGYKIPNPNLLRVKFESTNDYSLNSSFLGMYGKYDFKQNFDGFGINHSLYKFNRFNSNKFFRYPLKLKINEGIYRNTITKNVFFEAYIHYTGNQSPLNTLNKCGIKDALYFSF
jgi:hypothetical protein